MVPSILGKQDEHIGFDWLLKKLEKNQSICIHRGWEPTYPGKNNQYMVRQKMVVGEGEERREKITTNQDTSSYRWTPTS